MDKKNYWFFGSKLNTVLLLILIILMVIALKFMFAHKETYIPWAEKNDVYSDSIDDPALLKILDDASVPISTLDAMVGADGLPLSTGNETFNNQPGSVKGITKRENSWILSVDMLTPNPHWIPGENSFFLNQNTKIRDLSVTIATKAYSCGENSNNYNPGNLLDLMAHMEKRLNEYHALDHQQKESTYISYYFDINGSYITAIYEQCLP